MILLRKVMTNICYLIYPNTPANANGISSVRIILIYWANRKRELHLQQRVRRNTTKRVRVYILIYTIYVQAKAEDSSRNLSPEMKAPLKLA